jgi:hypothetical protein
MDILSSVNASINFQTIQIESFSFEKSCLKEKNKKYFIDSLTLVKAVKANVINGNMCLDESQGTIVIFNCRRYSSKDMFFSFFTSNLLVCTAAYFIVTYMHSIELLLYSILEKLPCIHIFSPLIAITN